jgi:hypothetical protein
VNTDLAVVAFLEAAVHAQFEATPSALAPHAGHAASDLGIRISWESSGAGGLRHGPGQEA